MGDLGSCQRAVVQGKGLLSPASSTSGPQRHPWQRPHPCALALPLATEDCLQRLAHRDPTGAVQEGAEEEVARNLALAHCKALPLCSFTWQQLMAVGMKVIPQGVGDIVLHTPSTKVGGAGWGGREGAGACGWGLLLVASHMAGFWQHSACHGEHSVLSTGCKPALKAQVFLSSLVAAVRHHSNLLCASL